MQVSVSDADAPTISPVTGDATGSGWTVPKESEFVANVFQERLPGTRVIGHCPQVVDPIEDLATDDPDRIKRMAKEYLKSPGGEK